MDIHSAVCEKLKKRKNAFFSNLIKIKDVFSNTAHSDQ